MKKLNIFITAIFLALCIISCDLTESVLEEPEPITGGILKLANRMSIGPNPVDAVIIIDNKNKGILKYGYDKSYTILSDGKHKLEISAPEGESYFFGFEGTITLSGGGVLELVITKDGLVEI